MAPTGASQQPAAPTQAASSSSGPVDAPPPPVVQLRESLRPKESSDWQVVEVPGGVGWLRFNKKQKRLDAHCGQEHCHGKKCKVDRKISRGVLGFHWAWLNSVAETTDVHSADKPIVSHCISHELRKTSREAFIAHAGREGGVWQEIVDCEMQVRGTLEDSESIPCAMPQYT